MLIRSHAELVPAARAALDLGKLAEYNRLRSRIPIERERYYKVHRQTLQVVNSYFETDERADTVRRLRREIRMATKGIPTSALDGETPAGYISNGTEQLYNAQSHLLRSAYRRVAPLVHPDRSKYSAELFQQVNNAYALRDLTFLQEIYNRIVHEHDVFWCSSKGLDYVKQEIERPKVSLRILQSTPEFEIARAHQTGKRDLAKAMASRRLAELVVKLQAELNHLLTPSSHDGGQHVEKESGHSSSSADQGKEASASGCVEADADPESATGESSEQEEWDYRKNSWVE
jgi:hypothetical protein